MDMATIIDATYNSLLYKCPVYFRINRHWLQRLDWWFLANKRKSNKWYNIYMLYGAYYHSLYVTNVYILVPLEIDQSVDMNHDLTQNLASENLNFQNSGSYKPNQSTQSGLGANKITALAPWCVSHNGAPNTKMVLPPWHNWRTIWYHIIINLVIAPGPDTIDC